MALRLWPQNFENKDFLTNDEKQLLRNANKNFKDGHFAVCIDPMGRNSVGTRMGMYVSPREGLITFSIIDGPIKKSNSEQYKMAIKVTEEIIYSRLVDSLCLISRNGNSKVLKFPYKHVFLFPDVKKSDLPLKNKCDSLKGYVCCNFFRPITSKGNEKNLSELKIFGDIRKPFDNAFTSLSDIDCKAIFERLAPEYTVVMNETLKISVSNTDTPADISVTGKEVEYKTFFLDEYQVGVVNEMGKEHRVMLANPGAGKSVLLLAKAFKYSNVYKNSNVLLTCYNNNLADSYKFKYDCAGYVKKNLFICTFHKLVKKIFEECLNIPIQNVEESSIRNCIKHIKKGNVKIRFKAIFIDEVQIFDPLYLELCYLLLDRNGETDKDYTFLMAGDLNQKIRSSSKRGDAPWKRIENVKLNFSGRVNYIDKNYRNSYEISEYIHKMLGLMNDRMKMLGIINSTEFDYNNFKFGEKKTIKLKKILGVDRLRITKTVVDAIEEITEKYDVSYDEIAVLFPFRHHKSFKYYFLNWIERELTNRNINFSEIISTSDGLRTKYRDTSGIVLSTIESSLGLDFKAVIVAGLYPYHYIIDNSFGIKTIPLSSWGKISELNNSCKELVQNQMRAIYTACSRARELLYVISDLPKDSPMEEILK